MYKRQNIIRPNNIESTALGACKVSMLGSGLDMNGVKSIESKVFAANQDNTKILANNYKDWSKYVSGSLNSIKE